MHRKFLALALLVLGIAPQAAGAAGLKIDSKLRALRAHPVHRVVHGARATSAAVGVRGERIPCFVMGRVSQADLLALGIPAGAEVAGIVTADLTWDDIERLSAFPGVESITLSQKARPLLDQSRVLLHADQVNGGTPPNYPANGITGKGTIVGFVDTGIDWRHADFLDKNGTNRILDIWDQTDLIGPHPTGYGYGSEWGQASILAGAPREIDDEGHGTHVAGIAAGSGRGTGNGKPAYRYIGMAPEASIIAVKTDFSFSHIIDGVKYIFDRATALGKPAVVNLSLGSNYGPHDGSEPQDSALNALSGPGHIVCVSAGNSGGDSIHAEVTLAQGQSDTVTFHVYPYTPNFPHSADDFLWVDAYYKVGDAFGVQVRTPSGNYVTPPVLRGHALGFESPTGEGYIYIDNGTGEANSDNDGVPFPQPEHGEYNLVIQVYDNDSTKTPAPGDWKIQISGNSISAGGHMDLWMADYVLGPDGADIIPFRNGYTHRIEVSSPATAESTLCVGAFTSRTNWPRANGSSLQYGGGPYSIGDIAYFSALGPTADGRQRPTIAAPGFGVASTKSISIPYDAFTVDDSVHIINQGTSMAAPHVTGVVALILQNHPLAPPALVKAAIESTSTRDSFTGAVPNGTWGFGKLDAFAVYSTVAVELYALDGNELAEGYEMSWSVADGAEFGGFEVQRAAAAAGPWTTVSGTGLPASARSFLDHPPAGTWYYRVAGVRGGNELWIGPFLAQVTGTAISVARLLPPTPNPSSGSALVSFVIPGAHASTASLDVFDVSGRRVASLAKGLLAPGRHNISWDGRTASGMHAGAGLYFLRLQTEQGVQLQRLARLE